MTWGKILRRVILAVFSVIFALNAAIAHAEVYTGVGEYFMTDENVEFAKNKSELAAQRAILEEICVYVKSRSIMINSKLDNDEIIMISAGILHVINTKFLMEPEDDLINVKSFVTAKVDIDELIKLLEQEIKYRMSKR